MACRRPDKKEAAKMISGVYSALTGLYSFQKKAESSANNTANINTDGYKKTRVTLEDTKPQGVKPNVKRIETPGPLVYEQTSEGETLVEKSNVDLSYELPNMMLSRRFYQANIKTIQIQDEMLGSLLDIKG
ncbi:MAG: flagellar basal body rod C-terminal domain-containing protein [Thermodesulfobacteriota bacterium]|nr:flagellar basal body rod C-terminal domain-containing protein [Thermodesulfobacteriota bacterium]